MASIYKRTRDKARKGSSWYIGYVDERGRQRTTKGCPDKTATEAMARKLESDVSLRRQGLIDPKEDAYRNHDAHPLMEHLSAWRVVMLAKGRTAKHAELSHTRATQVVTLASAARLSDLQPSRIQAALAALRDSGRSLETCNHHRASIRAFIRWARADGRLRDDPMAGVTGFNAREDVRHARRSLSEAELANLIQTAEAGPVVFHMDGPTRAMAYRVAAGTGFRADELRSLTPQSLRLDGTHPRIVLRPKDEKSRRGVEQPISTALARVLRHWLVGKAPGQSVFPLHHETAKMIRRDLEAAGISYETEAGFADFHSLRGTYISALVRSGASIKTVQTLARHSNPALTLARYARVDIHDVTGAVEALPDLRREAPEAEPLAMTGTDSVSALTVIGSEWPVNEGREETANDAFRRNDMGEMSQSEEPQPLEEKGFGHPLSASGGENAERAGFEPARHLSASNGLANRRFRPLSHLSDWGARRVASPGAMSKASRPYQTRAASVKKGKGSSWRDLGLTPRARRLD